MTPTYLGVWGVVDVVFFAGLVSVGRIGGNGGIFGTGRLMLVPLEGNHYDDAPFDKKNNTISKFRDKNCQK